MNYALISQIVGKPWFIDQGFAQNSGSLIQGILNNSSPIVKQQSQTPFLVTASCSEGVKTVRYNWDGFDKAEPGSIAILKIRGALTKSDQWCGPVGMETIGRRIQEADVNENIAGIVLEIDSPGGTVDGTETLGNIIKSCNKRIVGFVNGMACSAAMWLVSCCDNIIASNDHAMVGSIGVMTSYADMLKYYKQQGLDIHIVNSNLSQDKNKASKDLAEGKYEDYKKDFLDPLAVRFHEVIKSNRNVDDSMLTGKVYYAQDCVGSLVDEIGTLETALLDAKKETKSSGEETSSSESDSNESTNSQSLETNNIEMKQFANINAVLGELESADGNVSLNEEQLGDINSYLEKGNTATQNLTKVQGELASSQARVSELETQVANLQKGAGATTDEVPPSANTQDNKVLGQDDVEMFNNL